MFVLWAVFVLDDFSIKTTAVDVQAFVHFVLPNGDARLSLQSC